MELKRCDRNGCPKLIFVRHEKGKGIWEEPNDRLDPTICEDLPRIGWKVRKFPAIQIWSHLDVPDVLCEIGHDKGYELDILRMLLGVYPIFERAQCSGGLPLHAGLVERNGNGILLAASGSIGKSTCCRRFRSPWKPLCDDESLVVRNDRKQYQVHPFPTWSDYLMKRSKQTWNVQYHLPLSAIFFLEQAEADEVVPMGLGEAAVYITQSAHQVYHTNWRKLTSEDVRALRKEIFQNSCELAKAVDAFKLRLSLKGRFWEKIEAVLP
jgi:SynChlorMet cassette protein ScmC